MYFLFLTNLCWNFGLRPFNLRFQSIEYSLKYPLLYKLISLTLFISPYMFLCVMQIMQTGSKETNKYLSIEYILVFTLNGLQTNKSCNNIERVKEMRESILHNIMGKQTKTNNNTITFWSNTEYKRILLTTKDKDEVHRKTRRRKKKHQLREMICKFLHWSEFNKFSDCMIIRISSPFNHPHNNCRLIGRHRVGIIPIRIGSFLKREANRFLLNTHLLLLVFTFIAINHINQVFFHSFIQNFAKEKSKNVFYIYAHFVQHVGCLLHYKLLL